MNPQEKIIKPSLRYLSQEIGAGFLFLFALPIAGILYYGEKMYFAGGLLLLIGILSLISEIRTSRKQQITFSNYGIFVKFGKDNFKQSWESIKAIKFTGQGQSRMLVLYCDEQNLNIPCKFFDEAELVEELKRYLSPSVFHSQAYQKLPQFLEWQETITKRLSTINEPLKVSLGKSEKWIGILSTGLGVFFAGLYYFSVIEPAVAIMMGGLFGGLGILILLLCLGWVEGNNETISVRTLFQKYNLSWNELREIYINSSHGVLALVGDNSRLIVPSASSWSGKDKELLFQLISLKIEMSKIEPIESNKPLYWQSKNA